MTDRPLNAKQQRFVEEYLIDLNATQAATRAGYSAKTARSQGQRMLTHVDIASAIERAQQKRAENTGITQDWVLESIYETVERCKQAAPVTYKNGDPVMTETPDGDIALAYSFDSGAVLKGAELAGKHLGMFIERRDVNVTVSKVTEEFVMPSGERYGTEDQDAPDIPTAH